MASKLHTKTKELLEQIYPSCPIKEEVPIKINGRSLFIDLVVDFPFNIAVECQGEQHDKFVPHFHKTKHNFMDSQRRDRLKSTWCYEKAMPLVYVYEYEYDRLDVDMLKKKIEEAERLLDKEFGLD